MTPITSRAADAKAWWNGSVGYEIYLRSFSDSNGDGVGDLAGITQRLDYLHELGVDLLWITPFYPSPMYDYGYDVADYCAVDPLFGSIEHFDKLLAEAHRRNLRVVIDIVPNHCSIQHKWFQRAVDDPTSKYRDYFIWRKPPDDGGPPNNWRSCFGGRPWSIEPKTGEYYLHLFLPEQPDLNWRNPAVQDEFTQILQFWLDRGVDGFRIDVAQALVKDEELRDNVQNRVTALDAPRWEQWDAFDHLHDIGQVETLEIFKQWRSLLETHDAILIGETYVTEPSAFAAMLPGDGLHRGFWFKPMFIDWDADQIREVLSEPLAAVESASSISWVSSSHDDSRPATRFGGGDVGRQRALAFSTLLFCLPGLPFLYQGEELGLVDGIVTDDERTDPVGADVSLSRDGSRTPMPWEPGPGFGFSSATRTWLPLGGRHDSDTAHVQRTDKTSWFHRFRALVELRKSHPELWEAGVEWVDSGVGLVSFRRGEIYVSANAGNHAVELGVEGVTLFSTLSRTGNASTSTLIEPREAIVVLENR
jgi:alpha-glucosidase